MQRLPPRQPLLFGSIPQNPMRILLKIIHESSLFALHALKTNRLRTILSLLGITIGIFSIISVFTVVDSLEANIRKSIRSLGDNVIYIQKWPWIFEDDYPWWKYANNPRPSYQEMDHLREKCVIAEAVTFRITIRNMMVKYLNSSLENISVYGISEDFEKIKTLELSRGRYLSALELREGKGTAIVGADIAGALFGKEDPIDRIITIRGSKFRIAGVLKREGKSIIELGNLDNTVILPVNYIRHIVDIRGRRFEPEIIVKGMPGISNEQLKDELMGLMRSLRRIRPSEENTFSLNEAKMLASALNSLFKTIKLTGWIIGGFAILVGGFGVANIMFVSARERTPVIGIQKALGAKNYFILLEFLSESVILSMIGGAVGLLLIFGGVLAVNVTLGFPVVLSFSNILLGLEVSAAVGLSAGLIPAYSASRMAPAEAMRMS